MITALPGTFEEGYRSVHREPQEALGECWHSNDLNIMTSYVRFSEDVDIGDAVRTKFNLYSKTNLSPQESGGSVYAPAGSMQIIEHDANYLTSLDGIPPRPSYRDMSEIHIVGGTGVGQHGIIDIYSDKVLNVLWYSDDDATKGKYTDGLLTTALDATSDYVITAPWYVEKAIGGVVNGVVITKAKAKEYALVITSGRDFVKVQEAVTAGQTVYPAAASADEGEGEVPTAVPLFPAYATVEHAGAAESLVRANIYAQPISIVAELPRQQVRGFPRPRTTIT